MRFGSAIAVTLLILLAACGRSAAPHVAGANSPEAAFLGNAAMFENYAIQAAELAQAHGQSDAVKTYAASAITEHRAMLQQLTEAARQSGLAAPDDALDDNYRAYLGMLEHQNPQSFDTTYASQQSIAYISASGQYDTFVASAGDSPLRSWAQSQTEHLHDGIAAAHALAAGQEEQ
jgi:putative membrane protein